MEPDLLPQQKAAMVVEKVSDFCTVHPKSDLLEVLQKIAEDYDGKEFPSISSSVKVTDTTGETEITKHYFPYVMWFQQSGHPNGFVALIGELDSDNCLLVNCTDNAFPYWLRQSLEQVFAIQKEAQLCTLN